MEETRADDASREAAEGGGAPSRVEKALSLAYRYVDRRERTQAEVRRHLEAKGFDDAVVEQALAELLAQGYVNDARYARLFAEDKRELEAWGKERIARSLLERGVERELVDTALGEGGETNELERALDLLRRRLSEPPCEPRERERALGMLLRKGYDSELALDALRAFRREAAA